MKGKNKTDREEKKDSSLPRQANKHKDRHLQSPGSDTAEIMFPKLSNNMSILTSPYGKRTADQNMRKSK